MNTKKLTFIVSIQLLSLILPSLAVVNYEQALFNQIISTSQGNVIYSPFSLKMALAMAAEGGVNQTQTQILTTCNLPNNQQTRLKQMLSLMQNCQQSQEQNFTLTVANSIWTSQQAPPTQTYINTVKNNYLAQVSALDFNDSSLAVSTINSWISAHTNNLINNVLSPSSITSNTYMILVNAIYFKGSWKTSFNVESTEQKPFYTTANSFSQVSMMTQTIYYQYYQDNNIQLAELPYDGDEIVMDIILPQSQSLLSSVEADIGNLNNWLSQMYSTQVQLFLPKFKFDVQQSLKSALENMGITDAFNRVTADFSGIDGVSNQQMQLWISDVIQQAYIQVDEQGTKAAAATVVVMHDYAMVIERPPPLIQVMNCNHPFIFTLRNIKTQQILFVGKVVDPSSSS